jgi:hypothetical protein
MSNYWIYNRKYDLSWILLPPFVILLIVLIFHQQMEHIEKEYSFVTWLILIVFIDVAHVYASIFRSYLLRDKWQQHKRMLLVIPAFCFIVSVVLFSFGSTVFWSVLAYIAVFHFIRQQYGFMRLYSRKEQLTRGQRILDAVVIYNATVFPMLYWFLNPDRAFTWFMENEFYSIQLPFLSTIAEIGYFSIILLYLGYLFVFRLGKRKPVNYPKLVLLCGTYLSWYFGIVYFNNELIFTALNVVSHGIPYMGLVYYTEFTQKSHNFKLLGIIKKPISLVVFIGVLLLLAITEEFTWENLVWKEQISWMDVTLNEAWVVPLLALPQFTHYILDAFIWRRNY